jgi:hypothetical protein
MTLQIYLVGGLNGGAGRSLTAALLAHGLHLQGRPTMLVQQTCEGLVSGIDALATTLPFPCCQLALPVPYELPVDLGPGLRMMVERMDARFMDALQHLALEQVGDDADVVVDLCINERAFNTVAIREATMLVLPVRTSPPEIEWAVRSFARARDIQRYRELVTPTLLATIAPEAQRNRQQGLLRQLLRDCDPDRDLLPGDPSQVMVDAPYLDEATLIELLDERPIWDRADLVARCRTFAEAVAAQADAFLIMMEQANDDL